VTLTADERAYLTLYTPKTHGVELPRDLAKSMEAKGWVEWVPPMFGSSRLYSITEAGRQALERDRFASTTGGRFPHPQHPDPTIGKPR
jgi:hypothetical protein